MRITQKVLETMISDLNISAGLQHYCATKTGEGSYTLRAAYGGYQLQKYTTGTRCENVSNNGFGTARQFTVGDSV